MQIVETLLSVTGSGGTWADELGKAEPTPEIAVGVGARLRLDLRSGLRDPDTRELLPLRFEDVQSNAYYLALDNDYNKATIPKLYAASGITIFEKDGRIYLDADLPNTALPGMLAAVKTEKSITLHGEIGGYSADPNLADFVIQFDLVIRNRVYLDGDVPEEVVNNPEYLTAAQIKALIDEALRPPKGDPGKDAYEVAVGQGYKGTRDEWLALLKGDAGEDAYEVAVGQGYAGTRDEWLAALRGDPGYTAYEVAVIAGYRGTVGEWLASLKGDPGKDGDKLGIDGTGELTELDAYSGERKGYVFAASVTDAATKTTKLYLWAKRSDDYGDWCNPTVITYYERATEIQALPPVKFAKQPEGTEYFSFDLSEYPYATIAAVCIDTAEGELTLPYGSALGVRKIVKGSDRMYVYFGTQVPAYESGRIYLSQFLGVAESGGSTTPEGTMHYGFIPRDVAGSVYRVTEITPAMLADSRSSIASAEVALLDNTSLGVVPEGALVVVLLPTDAKVRAAKFDGVGGWTAFYENNVASGTGANGKGFVLDGKPYEIYGEFVLAPAELFFRITAKE